MLATRTHQREAIKCFLSLNMGMCLGNDIVYVGFGTIHHFRRPLGVLEHNLRERGAPPLPPQGVARIKGVT